MTATERSRLLESLLEAARRRDGEDPAAVVEFLGLDGLIYLEGNSLGPCSAHAAGRVAGVVQDEWAARLARGWAECGWMEAPERVGDLIAPLIGAGPGEVLVADTTSVALAKLVVAALRARPERRVVVSSADNFPSDLYAAGGAVAQVPGARLEIVERGSLADAITSAGSELALTYLTQVDFRTGELHDLPALTDLTHRVGGLALWDLCHSAGAVEVGCEENNVDLAVGCTYKYLNGGPGSPSFLYVRRSLQAELANPLPGWLGHESPFSFELDWRPVDGIRRFLTSSPPVIALAALEASLECFAGYEIAALRRRSLELSECFIEAIDAVAPDGLAVASPRDPSRRGAQVSLRCAGPLGGRAAELAERCAGSGVLGDVRPPDLCRFGFSPLFLSRQQAVRAAGIIAAAARDLVGDPVA